VEFLSNLDVKSPLHKRKASLLKTFWRRFCRQRSCCQQKTSRSWRSV